MALATESSFLRSEGVMGITQQMGRIAIVVIVMSLVTFMALRLSPGDPALRLLGPQSGRADVAIRLQDLREDMGLDRSLPVQYGIWAGKILRGDFGVSSISGGSVFSTVLGRLPVTLTLLGAALVWSVPTGVLLGVTAAARAGSLFDRSVRGVAAVAMSMPVFWTGLLLLLLFAVRLDLLPVAGYRAPGDGLGAFVRHLVLPAFTLGLFLVAGVTRFVYAQAREIMQQDFVLTARANGVPERTILWRYVGRNSLVAAVTFVAYEAGTAVGGAILVEEVFDWSGVGVLLLNAVLNRDYQLVQGAVVIVTLMVLFFNIAGDSARRRLSPVTR